MTLKSLIDKAVRADEHVKTAKAEAKKARDALKREKQKTDAAIRAAIARALFAGYEAGWVTADMDRLEASAPTFLSRRNRDAAPRLLEMLRKSAKTDAETPTEPEDEVGQPTKSASQRQAPAEPSDPSDADSPPSFYQPTSADRSVATDGPTPIAPTMSS
jgi:hypothetical protein